MIDKIKSKLDLVQYISRSVELKKAGKYLKARCPFHNENTPSFMVDPTRQTWRCYGACAEGGDLFDFVQKQHGWSFDEALRELAKEAGVEFKPKQTNAQTEKLLGLLETITNSYHRILLKWDGAEGCRAYLEERGITSETIETFQLGYAPPGWETTTTELQRIGYDVEDIIAAGITGRSDKGKVYDRFRNRLMIPIQDSRGRVVGFGARALDPKDEPKYLNSPQTPVFNKGKLLYGLNHAKVMDDALVIVEGYFDVIMAHQTGFKNVVAQMGTALTGDQIRLLSSIPKIVLSLDGDNAGKQATWRDLEHALRYPGDIRIAVLPEGLDPDDVIRESPAGWLEVLSLTWPVGEYVIAESVAALPEGASIAERELLAKQLLPLLVAAESNLQRMDNAQKLALRLRLDEKTLMDMARGTARSQKGASAEIKPEPQPKPVSRSPVEAYVIRAMLEDEVNYAFIVRKFRELEIPVLEAGDFTDAGFRHIFKTYVEGLAQFQIGISDYLLAHIENFEAIAPEHEAVDRNAAVEQALRLRLARMQIEITEHIYSDDLEAVRCCNVQKAAILGA